MLTCTFEDGHSTQNLRHVTAVAVVLDAAGEQILLVKRGTHLTNPGKYAFPGGYVDRDETVEEAAVREVLEETGYKVVIQKLLLIRDTPNRRAESKQNIEFRYLAMAGEKVGEADAESSEVKWFTLDDVPPEDAWAFDHYEGFLQFKNSKF